MKDRTLLMIPGPIEFEPAVLNAMGAPTAGHVAPGFVDVFGRCLEQMRDVWLCPDGQPFIMAGSGTLAMESPAANLLEPGDRALVISTGYFGQRYAEILRRHGAEVVITETEPGDTPDFDDIENQLKNAQNENKPFKLMTMTHVDTSTAVRVDPKPIGQLGRKYDVLTLLDGVCSIAGEELRQKEWNIDVALTASQKAIGVPPGLALLVAGPRAMKIWKNRKSPVRNYYADWANWLPIMEAYENRKPSYFGTPPVNLICALHVSLGQILDEGMEKRFQRHHRLARYLQNQLRELGLKQLPKNPEHAANTLSAPLYPENTEGNNVLAKMKENGVIAAGGLLPEMKTKYFRIGHMGAVNDADIAAVLHAVKSAI